MKLRKIAVRPDSVDRWRQDDGTTSYTFLEPAMQELGYRIPEAV
jgi:hypothetical protein